MGGTLKRNRRRPKLGPNIIAGLEMLAEHDSGIIRGMEEAARRARLKRAARRYIRQLALWYKDTSQ
mgnify:CR=1 FL=1